MEANYRRTQSIARPLGDSGATCKLSTYMRVKKNSKKKKPRLCFSLRHSTLMSCRTPLWYEYAERVILRTQFLYSVFDKIGWSISEFGATKGRQSTFPDSLPTVYTTARCHRTGRDYKVLFRHTVAFYAEIVYTCQCHFAMSILLCITEERQPTYCSCSTAR